jgi:nitroimidazol reductase NimA-like FMN-containing flavoprotein (pyridoxamine 5'-phosphate oxidase superfamily)
MRKSNREIRGIDALVSVMRKCPVCYLALFDEGYPYVVPLNFGVELQEEQPVLYFHGAKVGRKLDLLAMNPRVGFSMSCGHGLNLSERACDCSMNFESVCGNGTLEIVEETELLHGLSVLMENYVPGESFEFDEKVVGVTTLLKLTVHEMTGKRLAK